tara:strand:+ start:76666 stop:77340 length:675 start_codon:yes stop_codon:yes gene_type:complete
MEKHTIKISREVLQKKVIFSGGNPSYPYNPITINQILTADTQNIWDPNTASFQTQRVSGLGPKIPYSPSSQNFYYNYSVQVSGLTVPILLTQDIDDMGVYDTFDGNIIQRDILNNFVYVADTITPNLSTGVNVYFSGDLNRYELATTQINFVLDWGDGSPTANLVINGVNQSPLTHSYAASPSSYTITISYEADWGTTIIRKTLTIPIGPLDTQADTSIIPDYY